MPPVTGRVARLPLGSGVVRNENWGSDHQTGTPWASKMTGQLVGPKPAMMVVA
jgi:hypothetical protein